MPRIFLLFVSAIVLLLVSDTIYAQVTVIDTIFTPNNYQDPPMWARIHIPDPTTAKGIGIVMTHGYSAPPTGNQFWCDTLVAHGYLVMAIIHPDMDVIPNGLYPRLVRAAKTAVQFLRKNAVRFGIDTTYKKIIGWGQSQGSMIWGQMIIWDDDYSYFGTDSTISDHLDAAILLYGLYDMFNYMPGWAYNLLTIHFSEDPTLRSTRGQCITNVSNITTPVLLLHATGDPVAYIQQSRTLRDSLNYYGSYVKLIEFNSSLHTFDAVSDFDFSTLGLAAKDSAIAFLDLVTDVEIIGTQGIPEEFLLEQNYPNPFNPSTTISFSIPTSEFVTLKVYDVLGNEVATLINEEKPAGSYELEFDAAGLTSGIYFYKLTSGSFVETKKMLLLK